MKKTKRKRVVLVIPIIVIMLSVIFIRNIGKRPIDMDKDRITEKIYTTAFIIQEEDIINFSGINSLDTKVNEGVKVSLDTVVASSKNLKFTNQEAMDFDIINKKIEDEASTNNNIFEKDLEKLNKEINTLQRKIENAKDDNTRKKLMQEKENAENKKETIEGAFRYAFSDNETLSDIKKQMASDSRAIQGQITPKSLGLSYGGYIFFKKDGLENLLHKDLLGKITTKHYNEIEEYMKNEQFKEEDTRNQQLIKFIDDTKMYMILKVPGESFKKEEERLMDIKVDIDAKWKKEGQTDFYSYIETRRDILNRLPSINIESQSGNISGYLVDVNNSDPIDNYKVLTVKISTQNHNLIGQRQLEVSLLD